MAMADGYDLSMSREQIDAHLSECSDCRREMDEFSVFKSLFDKQKRQVYGEDIWRGIAERLPKTAGTKQVSTSVSHPFLPLGVFLIGYKLIEMVPDDNFGLWFKLLPIIFIAAAFGYLKENPFKINTQLRLESGE